MFVQKISCNLHTKTHLHQVAISFKMACLVYKCQKGNQATMTTFTVNFSLKELENLCFSFYIIILFPCSCLVEKCSSYDLSMSQPKQACKELAHSPEFTNQIAHLVSIQFLNVKVQVLTVCNRIITVWHSHQCICTIPVQSAP